MKTYQILNKNDILQEGDECFCEGTYFRPVIEKEYRILEQAEASLPTDEWWSSDFGWVVGHSDNTRIRRRLVKAIDWKEGEKYRGVGDRLVFKGPSFALGEKAAVVADRHDYIQKLEKDLSFYKEATDAAIADIHFYRRVIDKLTQDGPEEV